MINWSYRNNAFATHQPLLFDVLSKTTGPILELGCGDGSTQILHHFAGPDRKVLSVESEYGWYEKVKGEFTDKPDHEFLLVNEWALFIKEMAAEGAPHWGVIFIDQNSWDSRVEAVLKLRDKADFLVLHDCDWFFDHKGVVDGKEWLMRREKDVVKLSSGGELITFPWASESFYPPHPWAYVTGPPTMVLGSFAPPAHFTYDQEIDKKPQ